MRRRPPLPAGPYLVVGLARSGAAAALMLREHGEVLGCDSGHPPEADALTGVEVQLGSDGLDLLGRAATVVKSPGVPAEAPVVAAARERGIEVAGELELAWRLLPNEFIAVTGTNGKTTTVELLGAIHREAGVDAAVAGNVGTPLSSLAGRLDPGAVVVCEASSFQLEDTLAFAPECAVLLNLSEDHLDRHGSFAAYREAKLRAFANQTEGDVAVVPAGIDPPGAGRVVRFGDPAALPLPADEIRLPGAHNLENAMAASAAALARGLDPDPVAGALRTFAGVPHRLEEVANASGVRWVNDSKATNTASARVGIEAFPEGVHLIAGGSVKGGGFADLRGAVGDRCRAVYLIGEASGAIARDLEPTGVPLEHCGDLETAVERAATAAVAGEVVLLSPACASFDQFRDYEERGTRFRELARRRVGAA